MSPAQKVNNVKKEIQPVVVERLAKGIWYGFKLSIPSRERLVGKDRWVKLGFQVTPAVQQTPRELTSAVQNDLSVFLQSQTKTKHASRVEKIEIDKTVGYWVNCTVNLSGTTPDKLDDKIVSLCNGWLHEFKKNMVENRAEDRLLEDTVVDQAEDHSLTDQ